MYDDACEICHARHVKYSADVDGVETLICEYCAAFCDEDNRVVVPNEPV